MLKLKSVFLFLFFKIALISNAQYIDLSIKLEKKKSYQLEVLSKVEGLQNINNQDIIAFAQTKNLLNFKITNADKLTYKADVRYLSTDIQMKTIINGNEQKLGRTQSFVNQAIKEILKKDFPMNFSSKGKILSVGSLEDIFTEALKKVRSKQDKNSPINAFEQQQTLEQLRSSFGAETLRKNLETFTLIYPSTRVKIGDSWQITSFLTDGLNTKITTTYTLEKADKKEILIKGKAEVNIDNEPVTLQQGQILNLFLSGEILSEISLNPDTKFIKKANVTQQIKGKILTPKSPSQPEGKTIPIDTKSEILVENK